MRWRLNELIGEYQVLTGKRLIGEEIRGATGLAMSTISEIRNNKTQRAELDTLNRLLAFFRGKLGRPLETGDLLEYIEEGE